MSTLNAHLFGQFQLQYNHQPVTGIDRPRLQSLLSYLVVHAPMPQTRQHLSYLFWPESSEGQARTNLRKHLLHLRRRLPDAETLLQIDLQRIGWQQNVHVRSDVATFEAALQQAEQIQSEHALINLQRAVDLYRGDLLPDCYDDWVLQRRETLRTRYLQALEQLIHSFEEQRDYGTAIVYCQRLLQQDPLHEGIYGRLMRLHALQGDRAAALRVYHTCATQLARELDVEPGAELQSLYEQLRQTNEATIASAPVPAHEALFVGRHAEWQQLQQLWRTASRGHPHMALIAGEAGIGKTRLATELLDWARHQGIATAYARSYAAEGRLAYAPVVEWLRSPPLAPARHHLEDVWLRELLRVLPELNAQHPHLTAPEPIQREGERLRLFEALARALLAPAGPRLLVIDDLQWCDQETLEWLHYLLRFDAQAQLLVVGTVRPEEVGGEHPLTTLVAGLRAESRVTELTLPRLDANETSDLARQLAGQTLPAERTAYLFCETEGHPLFVVESVRAGLIDTGIAATQLTDSSHVAPPEKHQALPPKIQSVLAHRLSQLSPAARRAASLAAVIGREFSSEVLLAAASDTESEMVDALDELWQRHIIRERRGTSYDFSHDRLRDAAYADVSAVRRRLLHRRVATALERVHAADLDPVAAQLAAHYEQSGDPEQAIHYYLMAGEQARRIFANQEANSLLERGLALIRQKPETSTRTQQEFSFLLVLIPILVSQTGYGSLHLYDLCIRMQELCQQIGEPPHPVALRVQAICLLTRRAFRQVLELGEQLLAKTVGAESEQTNSLRVETFYTLGVTLFWQGQFRAAKTYLKKALAIDSRKLHALHILTYGQDPGVVCHIRLGLVLWLLGYPDQALQHQQEAIRLAHGVQHLYSLTYAFLFRLWLQAECGDMESLIATAEDINNTAQQRSEGSMVLVSTLAVLSGWTQVVRGKEEKGLALVRSGLASCRATQYDLCLPYYAVFLAKSCLCIGAIGEGLAALDEAEAVLGDEHIDWYSAERCRVRGALLDADGAPPCDVEAQYMQALDIARQQEAKSLELRAAMDLARLWQRQGRREDAHALLAPIYNWFTEGFDTPDLQAARALLAELT